ncbi:MAG: hypothetical protein AAB356_04985 [Deltaproteobacteria bacterium]
MKPGVYLDARDYPFGTSTKPNISISSPGRGCNKNAGRFIAGRLKSGAAAGLSELVDELGDEKAVSKLASRLFRDEDGFIENPEKMLEDCLKKVLNSGKLKPETEDVIKRESGGDADWARRIRERAEAKKRG